MHFLGKNLRFLRKQSSKTQSEIASLIQKGQTTIGNWENGISEPSLNELLIISNYFDISVDVLLRTDLADGASHSGGRSSAGTHHYDHSPIESPVVREPEERMTFVLQEIRNIRSEMEHLYARLHAKPEAGGDDSGNEPS